MSEIIATAQVLVVPNTADFAAALKASVEKAVAEVGPIAVPIAATPVRTGASGQVAREAAVVTASVEEQTAALTALGAQQTRVAATASGLAKAQDAAATAAKKLALAQEQVVGASSAVNAAQITETRSAAAVTAAETARDRALKTGNTVLIGQTEETLALAKAQQQEALTALEAARAQATRTAQIRQATRGTIAQTASFAGLRAGTLAASAPFIAATAGVIIFSKALREASDRTEELNKTAVVFGQSAKQIQDFAKTTASSLGISEVEALKAAGIFGNLFRSIDIGRRPAAQMSEQLVRLASDLASFNNADPTRVLEALRSGLTGQARPLRVFGIFLSQARTQQEALIETGKQSVKALTNEELVRARFNIILKDTTLAQGDFARTSDRVANQSRILKAQLSDLGGELGTVLLPGVLGTVEGLNLLIKDLRITATATEQFVGFIAASSPVEFVIKIVEQVPGGGTAESFFSRFGGLIKSLGALAALPGLAPVIGTAEALKALGVGGEKAAEGVTHVGQSLEQASEHGRGAANGIGVAVDQINHLELAAVHAASALEIMNLKIATGLAPGGRAGQEANLRQQIEQDKKAVAAADKGSKDLRDRLQELKSDEDALAALQQQDAQDAKDRADKIKAAAAARKAAAQKAAQAQRDATQAFIDSFGRQQQKLQNRLTSAQLFGNASQQIAINKLIIAADAAEIRAIQDRIRHLKLHGDALKVAQAAIAQLNQEIFNTRNAILQLQAQRKQAIIDARQAHLEALLAIAETTKSTADDKVRLKALIAFDNAQIARLTQLKKTRRLTQEEAAQLDNYRVDLAQRNEALRNLQKEQQKGNQTAKEFFNFLQTQAGFAANLLGNLIPGGSTAGLVGGIANAQSAATTAAANAAAISTRPILPQEHGIGGGVETTSALAASRDRGVRPIQVDTTNQLLRHIIRILQNQTGRMGHPEARYQKATSNAVLDTEHGHG